MLDVLVRFAWGLGYDRLQGHRDKNAIEDRLVAYYDPPVYDYGEQIDGGAWWCVAPHPPVKVQVRRKEHEYKTEMVFTPGKTLRLRRPNGDLSRLVKGEKVLYYFVNGEWLTWPKV